ncbi:MAG TPA: hypothetical protein VEI95_12800, partial [Acidobacteriota bacterium]|nr:hypothetical protein [Acidobacteriota bacterium]
MAGERQIYTRRKTCLSCLALLLGLFCIPTPSAAQLGGKPEKSNFVLSFTQASGAFTPLWVAQEAGLFKKHGLDATLKILN